MRQFLFIVCLLSVTICNGQLTSLIVRGDTLWNKNPSTGVSIQLNNLGAVLRSDTATMLSGYLRTTNASQAYQPIGTYVRGSDTALMLSPYLRSNIASATYQIKGNYLTANQSITISGDASGSGATSISITLGNNVVSLGKMAQITTASFLGRNTAATGDVEVLSAATVKSILALGNVTNESKATMFTSPAFTGTTTGITATMVGLGNVTNESKATMFTSPTFTGTPVLGTATATSLLATGSIGYTTGSGGTVTQATSKATGVTLNKINGEIVLNAAALAAATVVSFTLTNSTIAATDIIILNHVTTGTRGAYTLNANAAAGSATIYVRNNSAASLSEAIVIRFSVIKGVIN